MPANWGGFQGVLQPWFCGHAEGGEDYQQMGAPTAKKIADQYDLAIKTSAGPVMNMYQSGFNKSLMELGFKNSFNSAFNAASTPPEGLDLGVPTWIPAAQGTINGWLTATFVAMPATGHGAAVLPLTGGPSDHKLLDPGMGALMSLASSIHDAFHSENCAMISGILINGFMQHMSMINGLYFGLMPNPTGTPPVIPQPPVPWMGVM